MLFNGANKKRLFSKLIVLLALIPLLLSLCILLGWMFKLPSAAILNPNWYPMQFNTALSILLLSISILVLKKHQKIALWLNMPSLLFSILTLAEYVGEWNFHIDTLFGFYDSQAMFPGRMAPNTALCLSFISIAIIIYVIFRSRIARFIQLVLVCLVAGLSILAILGNILNIEAIYLWSGLTSMAMHTAISLLSLCSALMLKLVIRYRRFYLGLIQTMAITVVGSLLVIALWQFLINNANYQLHKKIENNANLVASELRIMLMEQYQAINRFFNRYNVARPNKEELEDDAKKYLEDMPNLVLIEWPGGSVIKPEFQNHIRINKIQNYCQKEKGQSAEIVRLFDNENYFCISDAQHKIYALFSVGKIIEDLIYKDAISDMNLRVYYENNLLFSKEAKPTLTEKIFRADHAIFMDFLDNPIVLTLWPDRYFIKENISKFPAVFLIFGLIVSILLALINYLKLRIAIQNNHLRRLVRTKSNRLVEIESRYERIYDYSPDMQLFVDNNNKIIECNETLVDSLGYFRKNGLLGRNLFDILQLENKGLQQHIEERIKIKGVINNLELKLTNLEGEINKVMLKASPFINKQSEAIGYLLSLRDISDIEALKEELKERDSSVNLFKENIALYDLILDETTDGWWDINIESKECRLSKKLLKSLGFEEKPNHVGLEFFKEHVVAEDFLIMENNLKKHLLSRGYHPFKQEVRFKHCNGNIIWIFCRGQGILDPDGKIRRIVGTHIDISALKKTQAKLSKKIREMDLIDQSTRLILMSDNIDNALQNCLSLIGSSTGFCKGILYRYDSGNNTMKAQSLWQKEGFGPAQTTTDFIPFSFQISEGIIGKSWREGRTVFSSNIADEYLAMRFIQWTMKQFNKVIAIPVFLSDKVEAIFEFLPANNTKFDRDEINLFDILASQLSLALDRKKSHYLLQHLALHDELTQLPNRRACLEMLDLTLSRAQRNDSRFALMFLDLDNFKEVNDGFGHHVGDMLLIEVSNLFKKAVRSQDYLARLGGDEFVVVITEIYNDDLLYLLANRLINSLSRPLILETNIVKISVSIGFVTFPEAGKTVEEILKQADHAMYRVKQEGKNSFYGQN